MSNEIGMPTPKPFTLLVSISNPNWDVEMNLPKLKERKLCGRPRMLAPKLSMSLVSIWDPNWEVEMKKTKITLMMQ